MDQRDLWTAVSATDSNLHSLTIQRQQLEYLQNLENGWEICINKLALSGNDENITFFCFQVIEHYARTRYSHANQEQQHVMRLFFTNWIQSHNQPPSYIQNKAAQVFCLVFLIDYPHRWPSFFKDVLATLASGLAAIESYLRLLKAIDGEVVDREIAHSRQEAERNTLIKDRMRDDCVENLVFSWCHILDSHKSMNATLVRLCLDVIGAYVSWIDIKLIANERFVSHLVVFLSNFELRECACDCMHEIICKGMDPMQKTELIESFVNVLDLATLIHNLNSDDDVDFKAKLAKLLSGMGSSLYTSWLKLHKSKDSEKLAIIQQAIHTKAPLMMQLLGDEDDDVSAAVLEFAKQYVQMLKVLRFFPNRNETINSLLMILFKKFKYDEYNFEMQGENEALFDEYRRQLKVLYDNLAQLDKDFILAQTKDFIMNVFNSIQVMTFQDVELAITLLYQLGEAIQVSNGNHFSGDPKRVSAMREMITALLTSGVINSSHMIVNLHFFETIVRYEKFFLAEPVHTTDVIFAFLDEKGMRNRCPKVRSRTAYLFSKFVKSLKVHLYPLTREILSKLQPFLILENPSVDSQSVEQLITHDDQIYIYETVAILIVSSQLNNSEKKSHINNLLSSVVDHFQRLYEIFRNTNEEVVRNVYARYMNHAMSLCSATSKAFSNNQTMKSLDCQTVYLNCLHVFLTALEVPDGQQLLHCGIRQNLHRMVVCLEDEILPHIPNASEKLLKSLDVKSIQEYIPLINQIMNKFRSSWAFHKHITPFLKSAFMPIVQTIIFELDQPYDMNDEIATRERHHLRQSYVSFISSVVANNVTDVLEAQGPQNLEKIIMTVVHGAQEYPDPNAQKTCFVILRGLLDIWSREDVSNSFTQFLYSFIADACFLTPLKKTFDLSDAQSTQVLSEIALCLRSMYDKKGDDFLQFLQTKYLNTCNFPNGAITYCEALKSGRKEFQAYLINVYMKSKS